MSTDNTMYLIGRARIQLHEYITKELEEQGVYGIVPSHGDIIIALLKHESLAMCELAYRINRDPSTVTTLVKKLNLLGYTEVYKDAGDKRTNRVSLTGKGRELEAIIMEISEKLYRQQYKHISEHDIVIFRQVLQQIIQNFT